MNTKYQIDRFSTNLGLSLCLRMGLVVDHVWRVVSRYLGVW